MSSYTEYAKPFIKKNILKFIGIFLFIGILSNLQLSTAKLILTKINFQMYIGSLFIAIPAVMLRAKRWQLLVNYKLNNNLSYVLAVKFYFSALFWGAVTPGKLGELYKIRLLTNDNIRFGHAVAASLVDRVLDLFILSILSTLGLSFYILKLNLRNKLLIIVLISGLFLLFFCMIIYKNHIFTIFEFFIKKTHKLSKNNYIQNHFTDIKSIIFKYDKKILYQTLGISILSWFFYIFQRYCFALSIDIKINFFFFLFIIIFVAITTLIPISIQGIGTRDVVLIFLLGKLNVPKEKAILLSSLIFIGLMFNACIGFIFFVYNKLKKNKFQDFLK